MPWRGPAGEARHTGAAILLRETRGQSPWRSRQTGTKPLGFPSRNAAYKQHPRMARRRRMPCWRAPSGHRCCAASAAPRQRETGGRPARREARVLAGQFKNAAPAGARSVGQTATLENPAHFQRGVRPALAPAIVTVKPRRQWRLGEASPRSRDRRVECGAGLPAGGQSGLK